MKRNMKNKDLIAMLQAEDPEAEVTVHLAWEDPEDDYLMFYVRSQDVSVVHPTQDPTESGFRLQAICKPARWASSRDSGQARCTQA